MKKLSIIDARERVRIIVVGMGYNGIGEEEMKYYVSIMQRAGFVGGEEEMSGEAAIAFDEGMAEIDKTFELRAIIISRQIRTEMELEAGGNVSDDNKKGGGEICYMA